MNHVPSVWWMIDFFWRGNNIKLTINHFWGDSSVAFGIFIMLFNYHPIYFQDIFHQLIRRWIPINQSLPPSLSPCQESGRPLSLWGRYTNTALASRGKTELILEPDMSDHGLGNTDSGDSKFHLLTKQQFHKVNTFRKIIPHLVGVRSHIEVGEEWLLRG